jgi:hypothetical protein
MMRRRVRCRLVLDACMSSQVSVVSCMCIALVISFVRSVQAMSPALKTSVVPLCDSVLERLGVSSHYHEPEWNGLNRALLVPIQPFMRSRFFASATTMS